MLKFRAFLEQASTEMPKFEYVEIDSLMEYVEDILIPEMFLAEGLERKVQSRTAQPWAKSSGKTRSDVAAMYTKHLKTIEAAKNDFAKKMKSSVKGVANPKILVDIKSLTSMVDKIVNRGKKPGAITDWLRGAILVKTEEDVVTVSKNIFKAFDRVEEYEEKNRGADKNYGYYGSKHFLVTVKGITSEVQVMTNKLWAYKGKAHKIYDKYRSAKDTDSIELAKAQRMSKQAFDRGNARGNARLEIDDNSGSKKLDSASEKEYKNWWKKNLVKVKR